MEEYNPILDNTGSAFDTLKNDSELCELGIDLTQGKINIIDSCDFNAKFIKVNTSDEKLNELLNTFNKSPRYSNLTDYKTQSKTKLPTTELAKIFKLRKEMVNKENIISNTLMNKKTSYVYNRSKRNKKGN